jgi:hypothetical protein
MQTDQRARGRHAGGTHTIRAKAGVVLATGDVSHHPQLRASLMPELLCPDSAVVASATGDDLSLAKNIGGDLT